MKFFEKLKGKYDLARWALKRAREAEAQVDELLQLSEIKDARIKGYEERLEEAREDYHEILKQLGQEHAHYEQLEAKMRCMAEAYAHLKVDTDVMRQEIKEYRRRLFEKEQDNAGNDRGE